LRSVQPNPHTNWGLCLRDVRKKDEKSAPKFVPSSSYHKEEEALKPTKTHYPSNPKPSFNPKRGVKRESPKMRDEVFVYMFCGHAGHLDEFCFWCKRIERRCIEYARNSYCDEFIDFPPRSYSHVPLRFYSCASPHTSSHVFPQFSYIPNRHSYSFGSQENRFEPRHFGYAHVLVVVIVFHVGLVFLLEGPTPTLSRDTWMVHVFPIVVHVPLGQVVRCKGL
jgi:hypothetical protein